MHFDDATSSDFDGRGDYVFDWARRAGQLPVRVQARRKFVNDVWGENWINKAAVKARFDREKRRHIPSMGAMEV
jgi:hypothetical protein